jgi:hypothetical protein
MHGDWYVSLLKAVGATRIRRLPRKKNADAVWGDPTPEDVWWPAPGSEDTELGVLMELEVGHGETEVYPRVQA